LFINVSVLLFLSFCEDKKTLKVEGFVFYLGWYWLLNKTFLHIPKVSEGFVNKLNSLFFILCARAGVVKF
jgi:hypothetical protein